MSNGSRILALPSAEGNIRAFSAVSLLIVDEASRCMDETYFAVRPMLAVSGGRIALLSTSFGRRSFFYDVWANGQGWERFTVKATDCPRITPEFLEAERSSMPDFIFAQEYLCEFTDRDTQVFSSLDIENTLDNDLQFLEW